MQVHREGRLRRGRRQAATVARAIRAGRARVRGAAPPERVDGDALRRLLAEAGDRRLSRRARA